MERANDFIFKLSREYQDQFRHQRVILSFQSFLELVEKSPRRLIRSAAEFIRDTFDHFGTREIVSGDTRAGLARFKLFDHSSATRGPIVGGEAVQDEIYNILNNFVRQGYSNKLILLHGPNGSAKTSTVEAIAEAMAEYSQTDEGAVYRFNWIFPTDKDATPQIRGEAGPIGFGSRDRNHGAYESYAQIEESKVACRIHSEFKDNPIFILPIEQRKFVLRKFLAEYDGIEEEQVILPPHIMSSGLSKRNQLIFENLMTAYDGDMEKVLRHVQVERFFYSRQYRVGISTVEPQLHMDAGEKQLTMDKNISNLPTLLHNIRFHEAQGELIEANRGLLEFSDLLKRPLDAYKYLLTTVERSSISLPSATASLDMVFMATTNEKHLDSFKTMPDFSSFRGRFELVTVPYLLRPSQEVAIYDQDIKTIEKTKIVSPHSLELLCTWAVMTRLKQPDPEQYDSAHRALIARLDPYSKVKLYEGKSLRPTFKASEATTLKELRNAIVHESIGLVVYEGRFGASPREVKGILLRASQRQKHKTLTPMAIFEELERIVKDRTVYEFLQFEPRGKYHDAAHFIKIIKDEFADAFALECQKSMAMVSEREYDKLLSRYIDSVVADVKKEKIYNPTTEQYEPPNQSLMEEVERIINVQGSVERHREGLISRIAAYRLDHPDRSIEVPVIFEDILRQIEEHYFGEQRKVIDKNYEAMLALETDDEAKFDSDAMNQARVTFTELERRFGYDEESARQSLRFMLRHNKERN